MSIRPWIAVDWGTARWRAMLISGGAVIDSASAELDLRSLDRTGMQRVLTGLVERWPAAAQPLLLAGMIGSEIGLAPVEQLALPADADAIARGARRLCLDGVSVVIAPGLRCRNRFGDPDVLRGEEVMALGALAGSGPVPTLLACVPGMHGKWLWLEEGEVSTFHTAMTVELATLMCTKSFLAGLMTHPAEPGPAFTAGVDRGAGGGSASRHLFSVRAAVVAGELEREAAASMAWGIVIGADVGEALAAYGALAPTFAVEVTGPPATAALYRAALEHLGARCRVADLTDLSRDGFAAIRAKGGSDAA